MDIAGIGEVKRDANSAVTAPSTAFSGNDGADGDRASSKRFKTWDDSDKACLLREQLAPIWEPVGADTTGKDAVSETMKLFSGEVESLVRSGLEAYQRWDNAAREIKTLKEELELKNTEIGHLRQSEESSRGTIQNLLQASEAATTEVRDVARSAAVAAALRADLCVMTSKHGDAVAQVAEYKRRVVLLQEEAAQTKTKLSRVMHEKIKLERDQRLSMSLAKSCFANSTASDVEYYKRQVVELNSRLQRSKVVLDDKNREITELHRQFKRDQRSNPQEELHPVTVTSVHRL